LKKGRSNLYQELKRGGGKRNRKLSWKGDKNIRQKGMKHKRRKKGPRKSR